jgi:hypothetical protein
MVDGTAGVMDGIEPDLGSTAPIVDLIASLLVEVCRPGEAVACTLLPSDARFAVRLPREAGKRVLLPPGALQRALVDPAARAKVRDLLEASIQILAGRRPAIDAPLAPCVAAPTDRLLPDARCARCEGPFLAEEPVMVDEASRWHLACPPAWSLDRRRERTRP